MVSNYEPRRSLKFNAAIVDLTEVAVVVFVVLVVLVVVVLVVFDEVVAVTNVKS